MLILLSCTTIGLVSAQDEIVNGKLTVQNDIIAQGNLEVLHDQARLLWRSSLSTSPLSNQKNYLVPRNTANDGWDWNQGFGYHYGNRAWYIDSRLGIGTDNPEAKLTVNGEFSFLAGENRLRWGQVWGERSYLSPRDPSNTGWDWGYEFGFHNTNRAWYFDSKLGIGTDNPTEKLTVMGAGRFSQDLIIEGDLIIKNPNRFIGQKTNQLALVHDWEPNTDRLIMNYNGDFEDGVIIHAISNTARPSLAVSGRVAIGSARTLPSDVNYKLAVKGKIACEELKVELSQNWGDFVFNKNYSLMPLRQIEHYINQNQHLPGIPNAQNIKEKGLEIGEMQRLQMIKIEELTLHLIEMKKEIDLLKTELKNK